MDNLLQGLGLFACIGAVLLVALVVFAFRAMTRNRGTNIPRPSVDRDEDPVFTNRGSERPRYDTREVESRGGFGGGSVPQTGGRVYRDREDVTDRNRSLDRDRGGLPPLDDDLDQARGADFPAQRRRRDDDDDVRSGGGFGG